MREVAHAKLNLALHIRAREADGYHRIETLFAFCEDGDVVEALDGEGPALAIDGPFAAGLSAGPDNLVRRAAWAMAQTFGIVVPPLRLTKTLPVAAGIGGGSADAAAAIRLLARANGVPPDEPRLATIAAGLGADVPACLLSRTVRGEGRGDVLTPSDDPFAGRPVLLANPRVACPTGPVFARWDGIDRGPVTDDPAAWRNDLQPPAVALVPAIAGLLDALRALPGAGPVAMSGSGATCFALFDDAAARDAAAARLAGRGLWLMPTAIR